MVSLALIIGVVAAEGILRVRGTFKLGQERAIRLREHSPDSLRHLSFRHEPALEQSGRIFRLAIDGHGFIMPGALHQDPDVTLVFLGGSTTECLFMEDNHRFPCRVGALLEGSTGLEVNAYNGGISGNHSLHSINVLLNKVLPLRPQIVVMMHNINDLMVLMHEGSYWNNNPTRSIIEVIGGYRVFRIFKNLLIPNLYEKMRAIRFRPPDEFARVRGRKIIIDEAWMLGQFEANLQTFLEICRAREITPVLLTQNSRFKEHPDPEVEASLLGPTDTVRYQTFRRLHMLFNDSIRTLGARNGVMVIDLAGEVPQEREYTYDSVHLTQRGSDFVSAIIADRLMSLMPLSSDEMGALEGEGY